MTSFESSTASKELLYASNAMETSAVLHGSLLERVLSLPFSVSVAVVQVCFLCILCDLCSVLLHPVSIFIHSHPCSCHLRVQNVGIKCTYPCSRKSRPRLSQQVHSAFAARVPCRLPPCPLFRLFPWLWLACPSGIWLTVSPATAAFAGQLRPQAPEPHSSHSVGACAYSNSLVWHASLLASVAELLSSPPPSFPATVSAADSTRSRFAVETSFPTLALGRDLTRVGWNQSSADL